MPSLQHSHFLFNTAFFGTTRLENREKKKKLKCDAYIVYGVTGRVKSFLFWVSDSITSLVSGEYFITGFIWPEDFPWLQVPSPSPFTRSITITK